MAPERIIESVQIERQEVTGSMGVRRKKRKKEADRDRRKLGHSGMHCALERNMLAPVKEVSHH